MRVILLLLHRWAGLAIAAFLVVSGLTGAIISWDHELDDLLNPHLTTVESQGRRCPPWSCAADRGWRSPGSGDLHPDGHRAGRLPLDLPATAGRSGDRPAIRDRNTIRSSSTPSPARSWDGATGAPPGRSPARTSSRSSTCCTTACIFPKSGVSTTGASGSWGSSPSSGRSTASSAST